MFFSLSDSLLTPWLANMVKQGQDEKFLSYLLGFFVSLLTPSSAGMIKQGKTRKSRKLPLCLFSGIFGRNIEGHSKVIEGRKIFQVLGWGKGWRGSRGLAPSLC